MGQKHLRHSAILIEFGEDIRKSLSLELLVRGDLHFSKMGLP